MVEFYKLPKDVSLMGDLFAWLEKNQYILQVKTYKKDFEIEGNDIFTSDCQILGVGCHRAEKKTKAELDRIRNEKAEIFA